MQIEAVKLACFCEFLYEYAELDAQADRKRGEEELCSFSFGARLKNISRGTKMRRLA